jgi:hypothetical protein
VAWRIQDCVVRGEIDNRVRGVVRGRLWLHGQDAPVDLLLAGNACPDLAGCRLTFENPGRTIPLPRDLKVPALLAGTAGDLTASRKVKLSEPDNAAEPAPERWGNALYLEWFGEAEGRVVIEATDFQLTLSPPEWTLTPAEEHRRQQDAEAAFASFIQRLDEALNRAAAKTPPPEKESWDEFDYERMLRESDARTDKYAELLDKYMDHPDCDAIVERAMGWDEISRLEELERRREKGEDVEGEEVFDGLTLHDLEEAADEALDSKQEPDSTTEGVDWVRDEDGDISHPLSLRAFNSSMALWHAAKDAGRLELDDSDLDELVNEFQITGAKLAGALDSLAYGRDLKDGPFLVAYLKRALSHLHLAQAALERVAPKALLPPDVLASARRELFEIREEILRLMQGFRQQE